MARYLVTPDEIVCEPHSGSTDDDVERLALMTPTAALHLLRGHLVLHAAVVVDDSDRAVVLAGDSASGKSVLAAALTRRGWRVLADDLAPLAITDGRCIVLPSSPRLHLWPDAAGRFGHGDYPCATGSRPLAAIWWLQTTK
ncbi:MAG: hypothetical protein ACYDD7_20805, partial [Acidimicrobiales bacterium]